MISSERRPSLNLSWITPSLAVGGRFPIDAAEHLARELSIRYVVDLRVEDRDDEAVLQRHGITLLHLPTEDMCAVSSPMILDGVQWVHGKLDEGSRVLVHCEHGIGRSALLALCVLVHRGEKPLDALERAKSARWVVSPSPQQLQAFIEYCAHVHRAHRPGWDVPSFDALANIAYRHLRQTSEARP